MAKVVFVNANGMTYEVEAPDNPNLPKKHKRGWYVHDPYELPKFRGPFGSRGEAEAAKNQRKSLPRYAGTYGPYRIVMKAGGYVVVDSDSGDAQVAGPFKWSDEAEAWILQNKKSLPADDPIPDEVQVKALRHKYRGEKAVLGQPPGGARSVLVFEQPGQGWYAKVQFAERKAREVLKGPYHDRAMADKVADMLATDYGVPVSR